MCSSLLMSCDKTRYALNKDLFHFTAHESTKHVIMLDLRQFVVILQEEAKSLHGHINARICTQAKLLLLSCTTTTECVLVDFLFYCLCRVSQKHRHTLGGAHFAFRPTQARKELCMNEGWLEVTESRGNITCETEIRVLVNSLRNDAEHVTLVWWKNMGKGNRKRRRGLHSRKHSSSTVVLHLESKTTSYLTRCVGLFNTCDGAVHLTHVRKITKDECQFWIKAKRNNVFHVLRCHFVNLVYCDVFKVEFFIIGELDDDWYTKRLLKPFGKHKRNKVTHVHRFTTRTTTSVDVEWLSFFVHVKQQVQVAM
uniref:Eukaryotic translation initiation factor 1A n=1 Tax=Lygus hesperus TaxID=30085 RepID=A0A0A9XR26_LYGHE